MATKCNCRPGIALDRADNHCPACGKHHREPELVGRHYETCEDIAKSDLARKPPRNNRPIIKWY